MGESPNAAGAGCLAGPTTGYPVGMIPELYLTLTRLSCARVGGWGVFTMTNQMRSAAGVVAISSTDSMIRQVRLNISMDQDDLIIAITTILASVVVALALV